eukprot:874591-Prymnesium_polylepis.3
MHPCVQDRTAWVNFEGLVAGARSHTKGRSHRSDEPCHERGEAATPTAAQKILLDIGGLVGGSLNTQAVYLYAIAPNINFSYLRNFAGEHSQNFLS